MFMFLGILKLQLFEIAKASKKQVYDKFLPSLKAL